VAKILVLCGLATDKVMECFYPRGVGCDIGCTGVVLLWSFRGEFMVRCGRLKAKGCRSFSPLAALCI
jgi:hypothetical protein